MYVSGRKKQHREPWDQNDNEGVVVSTVTVSINVPEDMAPYLNSIDDSELVFERNTMLL